MNDNLRMIEVSAVGYYSNATAAHTCWVTEEFVEKYKDDIKAFDFYFSDLDGKHSETHAEVNILEHSKEMALAWSESQGECWSITECMFDEFEFDSADIEEMISLNEDMNNTIEVKTQTIITIGTETIVV
ncbi:hypothetical protein VPFG_00178 [Vibrio phage nt-1]|uniref:Uncharacterized protein n=1 Tax=Vibrio phage nt-1 TaxID=115992 RepID=R9TIH5_9CAUD|nr:hypothetical protein VPFG_00178 [Vibrio phage nt-1]AGN30180.1 hypothetical protein VPFG_00178 [Vibrio phage nt-1]